MKRGNEVLSHHGFAGSEPVGAAEFVGGPNDLFTFPKGDAAVGVTGGSRTLRIGLRVDLSPQSERRIELLASLLIHA